MVLVVVGVEAAVHTGGFIVVVALAVAVIADLAHTADVAALATIGLVLVQVDAGIAAAIGVTNAVARHALFL
jgi:hypothetical protein